ncbi:MAG: hypothetical protein Q9227_009033 [Pyrenula ochraceoflavens]
MAESSHGSNVAAIARSNSARPPTDREREAMKARVEVPYGSPFRNTANSARPGPPNVRNTVFDNTDAEDADETLSTYSGGITNINENRNKFPHFGTDYDRYSLELARSVDSDQFRNMRGDVGAKGDRSYGSDDQYSGINSDFVKWDAYASEQCDDDDGHFTADEALRRGQASIRAGRRRQQTATDAAPSNLPHQIPERRNSLGSHVRSPEGNRATYYSRIRRERAPVPKVARFDNVQETRPDQRHNGASMNAGTNQKLYGQVFDATSVSSEDAMPPSSRERRGKPSSTHHYSDQDRINNAPASTVKNPSLSRAPKAAQELDRELLPAIEDNLKCSDERPLTPEHMQRNSPQNQNDDLEPEIDYSPNTLSNMSFVDLQRRPFEHDPHASPYHFSMNDNTVTPPRNLNDKMRFLLSCHTSERALFFRSLSSDEWEEAGDWIVESFSKIMHELQGCRKKRRQIAKQHELELAQKNVRVQKKSRAIDQAFDDMENGTDYISKRLKKSNDQHDLGTLSRGSSH